MCSVIHTCIFNIFILYNTDLIYVIPTDIYRFPVGNIIFGRPVLDLISGDTVFIKSRQSTNSYYGASDQMYCTFSGYKLNLEEETIIGNPGGVIG